MAQPHWNSNQFTITHEAASALTDHSLAAAPGTGLSFYITDIEYYQGATSVTLSLHNATTVADANRVWMAKPAINAQASAHFKTPIKVGSNLPLLATNSGTSTAAWMVITGFTARG